MEKKDLIKFLDGIFKPSGFSKKGSTWKQENEALEKIIKVQKSKYSDAYYLNYGFIIKGLDIDRLEMHIYNRLSSIDDIENEKIMTLLDLENDIPEEQRKEELKVFVENKLLSELSNTNTEEEIISHLKKRPHLNYIPLVVKKHFHLE